MKLWKNTSSAPRLRFRPHWNGYMLNSRKFLWVLWARADLQKVMSWGIGEVHWGTMGWSWPIGSCPLGCQWIVVGLQKNFYWSAGETHWKLKAPGTLTHPPPAAEQPKAEKSPQEKPLCYACSVSLAPSIENLTLNQFSKVKCLLQRSAANYKAE